MKKSLFYIAAMVFAMSCSSDLVEELEIANEETTSPETTFVSLNLDFGDETTTRISVTTGETDEDDWVTAWEYGDQIIVYSIDNNEYKTLSYNGSTFSGEVYTGENRIYHQYYDWVYTEERDGNRCVRLESDYKLFSDGGTPTVVSEEVINIESSDESIDVPMNQVGAAIDLRMKFTNIPDVISENLTLTGITIGGTPDGESEDDYTQVPYCLWTDPSAGVDTGFVCEEESGYNEYWSLSVSIAEENTEYSVQFGVLPFTIEAGKKLNVTLEFNDSISQSFDITNSSSDDFEFARGTHSYLENKFDLSDIFGDTWLLYATAFSDTTSTGTEDDPIEISTEEELAYLSLIANGLISGETTDGVYYSLTEDLDLDDNDWYPIGGMSNSFEGYFDGGNKTISNLKITDGSDGYVGLFGSVREGSVSNVKTVDAQISGTCYLGAVVGHLYYSIVSNCSNTGENASVYGYAGKGGVVGWADRYSTITRCYSEASISGNDWYTGGVVGRLDYYSTMTECYNEGDVQGYTRVGGVVGEACASSSVTKCYNTGDVSGDECAGGVAGLISSSSIIACYNTGDITGGWSSFGGVVGLVEYDDSYNQNDVTSCYSLGAVYGEENIHAIIGNVDDYATSYFACSDCYYLPATTTSTDDYATALTSVAALNDAIDTTYYTVGDSNSNILPSLLGESIEFIYEVPEDNVEDLTSGGGITSDGYSE